VAALLVTGTLAGALSSCSASPQAATVDGQAISVGALDQYLNEWSSSPAYELAFHEATVEQAAEAEQSGSNVPSFTVDGTGTGAGVYGLAWTTGRLTTMITALAVQQYLARHGERPTATDIAGAWASEYAADPTEWQQFPPALRSAIALQDADEALVEGPTANVSGASGLYKSSGAYFWSEVCLLTVDVSVPGPNGGTDMVASRSQADQIAAELDNPSAAAKAPPVTSGARYCSSPEQVIEQAPAFRGTVDKLAPGKAAALVDGDGYQVVQLVSRTAVPLDKLVAEEINLVSAEQGGSWPIQDGAYNAAVASVVKAAKVRVNPVYGSWATTLPSQYAPQVVPPASGS
jgi:hypothetical protein